MPKSSNDGISISDQGQLNVGGALAVGRNARAKVSREERVPAPGISEDRPSPGEPYTTTGGLPSVFISYRRKDSDGYAGRLFDSLTKHLGRDHVFFDIDTIQPGENFAESIETVIEASNVVVVLIGPRWLTMEGADGGRRLDDPDDWVRREVGAALQGDVLVVPVLVQGAAMPAAEELPATIGALARIQAMTIGPHWHEDVDRLAALIGRQEAAFPPG